MSGVGFSTMLYSKQKRIRSGDKLPDLLKIESELCSPVIHQLKVNKDYPYATSIKMQV